MRLQTNTRMAALLDGVDAHNATLPAGLAEILAEGLTREEGCYFLSALYSTRGNARLDMFPDATGYEAYVNHLHLDDFAETEHQLAVALLYIEELAGRWKQSSFADVPMCVIASFDGESCVVRLHAVRSGEDWLGSDLDVFEEAVFVAFP